MVTNQDNLNVLNISKEVVSIQAAVKGVRGRPKVSLDSARAVYIYLQKRIGYDTRPRAVPLFDIAKAVGITYDQARERIKTLVREGKVEKWTTKHNTQFKITYYRLPKETPNPTPTLTH